MEMNIAEIFEKSPLFAKGIWFLLLGMSFWSLTVATGKWWNLRKAQKETLKFAPRVLAVPRGGQPHGGDQPRRGVQEVERRARPRWRAR